MDIGEKIYNLRVQKGLTLEELGNMVGVGKSTVRKWEKGIIANMKRDKILNVAEALGTTPAYLMGWDESASTVFPEVASLISKYDNLYPIETRRFPLLGEIACGEPKFADEDWEGYVQAGADIDADFCLRAHGDSMINARINDGDIVFIKKQDMVDNGDIAAVIIGDEATLKRFYYYREQDLLVLKPENPAFKEQVYSGEQLNQVRVLGRAVAFQSEVK